MIKDVVKLLDEKKAENITIIDVSKSSPLCDYIVICTASNARHLEALAELLKDELEKKGLNIKTPEGKNSEWVLLDARDVVVHLFTEKERNNYNLEELFDPFPRLDIKSISKENNSRRKGA